MIVKRQLLSNLLAPLKVRDFRLLFIGQKISTIGDMFYAVALPWLMLSSGHTPQELGIVLPLSLVAAPLGAFAGLFLPAYYAALPEILGQDALQAGNALNTSSMQLALLIGSSLAGLVVSRLQSAAAFVVDALTFIDSALTLALMRGERVENKLQTEHSIKAFSTVSAKQAAFSPDITFWQLLRSWRLLQVAFLVIIFGNFLFNGLFEVALPTRARNQFMAGAAGYGLLLAMFGAGSLLGGLIAGSLGMISHRGLLMLTCIMMLGLLYSFVPFAGGLPGAALLVGCAGFTNGMLTVLAFTIMQQ